MSDVIKLLPDSVANQIAAGEVIQRPASVVKELVENAVDAGADHIQIIIKDAGRTLIQVVDNGCGMSPTDARLAFERHSTSKITAAADLFTLHTMGFRGEALASICAVSQVELLTMRAEESMGTKLVISASKVECQEPVATAKGSSMSVKNLFFNVPARRKFLKKDSVEFSNILHEFERLALVNPEIDLTLIHNGETVHNLLRGTLKQRIGQLFGKALERQLIPITTETDIVKVEGFVGLPENARRRGPLQYFFVNGRNMRHPYFHKAVLHCYEHLIHPEEQPNYFINFAVDPATIDVNIHPTKNEIKFENEQAIWQILAAAIRESLGRYNAVPAIDFDAPEGPELPAYNPEAAVGAIDTSTDYNPFTAGQKSSAGTASGGGSASANWRRDAASAVGDWEKLFSQFSGGKEEVPTAPSSDDAVMASMFDTPAEPVDSGQRSVTLFQLKNRYILSQNRSGLMIVDQHRAHLRVLFDRFSRLNDDASQPSQKVMFPEIVMLSPQQHLVLLEVKDEVTRFGFELSPAGKNSWSIDGEPASIAGGDGGALLKAFLDDMIEGGDITRASVARVMSLDLAKASAIPVGRVLTPDEMERLLSDLLSSPSPSLDPEGRRIIAEIPLADIERLF